MTGLACSINFDLVIIEFSACSILLTKKTAAKNEVALNYHRVRRLYFVAIIFAMTIVIKG